MEILNFVPQKVKRAELLWTPTLLVPVGDLQYGAEGFWKAGFVRWLEECFEEADGQPIYFLGMGDYADMLSPSNRQRVGSSGLYEIALDALEAQADRDVEGIKGLLEATKGQWIGMLEGHHYFEFDDGSTTDTRLCNYLETTFLGDCAQIHLRFKKNDHVSKIVRVWCHHGSGTGSTNKKLADIAAGNDADLLLMGHTPNIEGKKLSYSYTTDAGQLRHRERRVAGTGGWLRGYKQGSSRKGRAQGNYVEQRMLPPAPLGGIKIWLKPWRTEKESGVRIEVVI